MTVRRLELYAVGLSGAASVVHGIVVPEHLIEWWGYGAFFLIATTAQLGYAILLALQPWRYDETGEFLPEHGASTAQWLYMAGIAGNAAIITLYMVTRTVGIPLLGPEAGQVEALTPISVLSKLLELALIVVLVRLVSLSTTPSRTPA